MTIIHKKIKFFLITLCLVLICLEAYSYFAVLYLNKKGLIYQKPQVRMEEWKEYLNKRDAILGWRYIYYRNDYDSSGSRIIPAFPNPDSQDPYVSLYGDSFIFGAEVSNGDACSNVLAKLLGRRVSNYGVCGYGTDQSYLSFYHHASDKSRIVILGYLIENITRNINRYRYLLNPAKEYKLGFKPRFIMGHNQQIELIPLPELNYAGLNKVTGSPEKYLRYEYFAPNRDTRKYKAGFPFTISLIRIQMKEIFAKSRQPGKNYYEDFYQPGHSSEALEVTTGIFSEFYFLAKKRGQLPIIIMIPGYSDFLYYAKNNSWIHNILVERLIKSNMAVIDAGPEMVKRLKGKSYKELFLNPGGHYNTRGNQLLAEIIYEGLNNYFPRSALPPHIKKES